MAQKRERKVSGVVFCGDCYGDRGQPRIPVSGDKRWGSLNSAVRVTTRSRSAEPQRERCFFQCEVPCRHANARDSKHADERITCSTYAHKWRYVALTRSLMESRTNPRSSLRGLLSFFILCLKDAIGAETMIVPYRLLSTLAQSAVSNEIIFCLYSRKNKVGFCASEINCLCIELAERLPSVAVLAKIG